MKKFRIKSDISDLEMKFRNLKDEIVVNELTTVSIPNNDGTYSQINYYCEAEKDVLIREDYIKIFYDEVEF